MKDTVIVFARAPRLGTVKRRLARDIGDRAALRFYTATLMHLLRALARDRRFRTVVALTPDHARICLPFGAGRIPQRRGDLGERMHRACGRFRSRRVVIIGSDIPDATPNDVAMAFRALGAANAVFGPATDGGYWLVGLGPRRPARPFVSVRWSSVHALQDTRANFSAHRVALLRTLSDVDSANDLSGFWVSRACRRTSKPQWGDAIPSCKSIRSQPACVGGWRTHSWFPCSSVGQVVSG